MLECTEKCIYQSDGVCRKTDCSNAVFKSAVCPYFISSDNKIKQVVNTSDRDNLDA